MHSTTLTDADRRHICRLFQEGQAISSLAKTFNRSVYTVRGVVRTHWHQGRWRTLAEIRRPLSVSHPDERWVPLKLPTKTQYQISSYGRMRNTVTGSLLRFRVVFGYFSFEYTDQTLGVRKSRLVHLLVAEHFNRFTGGGNVVHWNHDCFDNHYRNLRCVTPQVRARRVAESPYLRHAVERTRNKKDGSAKSRKLTLQDVVTIKTSPLSSSVLAKQLGVATMQVQRVQRGESWSNVLPKLTRAKQPKPGTPLKTVRKVKKLLSQGKLTGVEIAAKTGLTPTTVCRINRGKTYAQV